MAYEINTSGQPKRNKRKWIFLSLGLLTTGLSLFGYHYWKKNKKISASADNAPDFKATKPKTAATTKTAKKPAAKTTVKTSTTPPGSPSPSFSIPNASTKASQTLQAVQARVIAVALHAAIIKKDFTKVYAQLRNIRSTKDYSAVSQVFSTMFVAGVRQTLVNALLTTFKDAKQKDTLEKSFRAMGLKQSDKTKKWSLSGTAQNLIITAIATKVWKNPKTSVSVPADMVLGEQVSQKGSFTLFENDKQYFLVETNTVKPYNS